MVVKTDKMQMTCYFIYVTANSRKGGYPFLDTEKRRILDSEK